MARYEASFQPRSPLSPRSPDASLFPEDDVDVGPEGESCGFCQGAAVWAYRLEDPDAGVRHFAVAPTWWTCDECHDLLEAGRSAPLAARLRASNGDWPDPDEVVRVVASSRVGPAERHR